MKMLSYLESRAKAYGRLEELEVDPMTARACTPGWSITVEAVMPSTGITMKMKPEVVICHRPCYLVGYFSNYC
jgi:hypothetical protein